MPFDRLAAPALKVRIAPNMGPMQEVQPKAKAMPKTPAPSGRPPGRSK